MSFATSIVPRQVASEVLESLYQHRLLSTAQVHAIHVPQKSLQWIRQVLRELLEAGHVLSAKARMGQRGEPMRLWYITERGAEAVERAPRAETRRVLLSDAGAAGQLQAHTLAVNDVGIAFMQAARARGDEFGHLAWRNEAAHEIAAGVGRAKGEWLTADAALEYQLSDEESVEIVYRFLELDRGTMPLATVSAKFGHYAQLARYAPAGKDGQPAMPLWRRHYPTLPAVLIVLAHQPRPALERRLDALLALAAADPTVAASEIKLLFGLLEDLQEHGPFAPIWARIDDEEPVDWLGRRERPRGE